MSRLARVGVATMATLLLFVTACSGAGEPSRGTGQEGYVGVEGNLTQIPPGQRSRVPAVSGQSLDGKALSTADFAGKVVVVNVWGSWCAPCRKEAPDLQAASVATRDVAQFVGISVKDLDPAPAKAFVRANQITYPSIYDPTGQVLLAFAGNLPPSAIPSTLVIDTEGRLAVRVLGTISERTLVAMITDVAAGT